MIILKPARFRVCSPLTIGWHGRYNSSTSASTSSESASGTRVESNSVTSANVSAIIATPKIPKTSRILYRRPVEPAPTPASTPSMSCTTISTCEQYDLAKVIELLYNQGLRSASILLPGEIAHVQYPSSPRNLSDVLILRNGTVVAWGMDESEVLASVVKELKSAEIGSYKGIESEDMDFVELSQTSESIKEPSSGEASEISDEAQSEQNKKQSDESSKMIGDLIVISGREPLLAKAAFSSGLSRSTKLAALENALENHLNKTKPYIENLASGCALGLQTQQVLQLTGQLLRIRGQLNLYSELIDTPDLYWEEPELENLYATISRRLDVATRIAILNKKLDYAGESVSILKSQLSEEHGVRLEWMIIVLIMVEVCFETFHFVENWYEKKESKFSGTK